MPGKPRPFHVDTTIAAPHKAVWQALTEPALLGQWFGWEHPHLAAEIQHLFGDHLIAEPPVQLRFDDGSHLALLANGPRTTICAVMPGVAGPRPEVADSAEEGWRTFLAQLRFFLETQPPGTRRTVHLEATIVPADALAAVVGRPWLDSRHQRIVVDPAGHLLALVADHPISTPAAGPVALTVTTYGLDDARFDAVARRWRQRWSDAPDLTVTLADAAPYPSRAEPPFGEVSRPA
ncbi:hypothetical protein GCM10010123_42660 [Pilimelia anulata]|uniref:SRPBCC domain-containing protein n=1 Tax=Pilimelia anulata TaxID=53371 RepID=A0A8J3FCF3_9ACTN|nr:hypothetical protein [Pilimelia anulata]GGK08177.1 hypothetical protein GCM10010123_42660 [Pilimelia anulata]